MNRFFLRCTGCLSVMSIDSDRHPPAGIRCTACDERVEFMGRVHQARLVETALRCPCDSRCTMASGPDCNCQCQGNNHGTGMLVTVRVDLGPVPRVTPPSPLRAKVRFEEWHQALLKARREVLDAFPQAAPENRNRYPYGSYDAAQAARGSVYLSQIEKAYGLRTHWGRLEALRKVTALAGKVAMV